MRRFAAARALLFGTLAPLLASTAGVVPAVAQQPTAQAVPGMSSLWDIWCGADGTCLAVGLTRENVGAVVVLRAGRPSGPIRPVPGTHGLNGIDCAAGGNCVAVGTGVSGGVVVGVVVEVSRDGTPGPARPVPGASGMIEVACPTATTCLATGALHTLPPDSAHGFTSWVYAVITNGQPQPARRFPRGTYSTFGIDCPTTTGCLVLARDAVVVLDDVGGTWLPTVRRISPDSGAGYPRDDISCASSTTCYATASGAVQTPEGYYGIPAMVAVSADGIPGPVQILSNQLGISNAISCVSGRNCTVVGATSGGTSIDVFRGIPAAPVIWENVSTFTGVSCIAPGTCGMVGHRSATDAVFAWHGPVPRLTD